MHFSCASGSAPSRSREISQRPLAPAIAPKSDHRASGRASISPCRPAPSPRLRAISKSVTAVTDGGGGGVSYCSNHRMGHLITTQAVAWQHDTTVGQRLRNISIALAIVVTALWLYMWLYAGTLLFLLRASLRAVGCTDFWRLGASSILRDLNLRIHW